MLLTLIRKLVAKIPCELADDVLTIAVTSYEDGYEKGRTAEIHVHNELPVALGPIIEHLMNGEKISAIKELRAQTRCGLRDGKDFCEALLKIIIPF